MPRLLRLLRVSLPFFFLSIAHTQPSWIDQSTTGNALRFWSIDFKDATTGWVTGAKRLIYKTVDGGYSWTKQYESSNAAEYFSGLSFVGDEGWAVGDGGAIYHSGDGGANWTAQVSGTTQALYSIHMQSPTEGVIVGSNKTILFTTDGTTWTAATVPGTSVSLYGIFMTGSTGYACGNSGRIYKTTDGGATWTQLTTGFSTDLEGIAFLDASNGYVSGTGGLVYKTNDGGGSWSPQTTGAGAKLYGLAFTSLNKGWAIATGTNIRNTTDGGGSWSLQASPVNPIMYGMTFINDTAGWACGDNGKIIHYTNDKPVLDGPTSHDFGILNCTSVKTDTFKIYNKGNAPLQITGMQFSGTDPSDFTLLSPTSFPKTIPPQDSLLVIIRWAPMTNGAKSAIFQIASNDQANPIWNVALTGVKNTIIANMTTLSMDYGAICLGSSLQKHFMLTVVGNINGTLDDFKIVSGDTGFVLISPAIGSSLSNGAPTDIIIAFQPPKPGTYNAQYKLVIGPCNQEIVLTLRGLGMQSLVTVQPPVGFDFGNVEVTKTSSTTFQIKGAGNQMSNIIAIKIQPPAPEFTITSAPMVPLTLFPGDERTVTVRFAPTAPVPSASNLCIVWRSVCPDSVCIPLLGNGFDAPHIIAPPVKGFRALLCTDEVTDTILVRNTGTGPLEISGASVSGIDAANFSLLSPQAPLTIGPKDSARFILRFSATTAGPKSASLVLTHNDVALSPTVISLTGLKNISAYEVQGDSVQALEACVASGSARTFKIVNTGSVTVKIDTLLALENGNVFHISSTPLPFDIQPGQSQTFEVNFTPKSTGQISARILIKGEPCDVSSVLTIEGIGIRTAVTAVPPSISFGDVKLGASDDRSIDITNTGTFAPTIEFIGIQPATASLQVTQKPATPFLFSVGNSFTVTVRFSPTTNGPVSASLCFRTSAPCQDTICIPITGNGSSATLNVSRSIIDYTLSACNAVPVCDTLTVTNAGTSTVDISDFVIAPAATPFILSPKPTTPYALAANQSLKLTICALANFVGVRTATFSILSNDPQRPKIDVTLNTRRDSSLITVSKTNYDFGSLTSCDSARTTTLIISNSGSNAEIITAVPFTDPAFSTSPPFPVIVQAGSSQTITVRFSPTANRSYLDSLVLTSSACKVKTTLRFNGVRAAPSYLAAPPVLDFKKVEIGKAVTLTLRVTNLGTTPAHIDKYGLNPIFSGFSVSHTGSFDLSPNGFIDIQCTFTPTDTLPHTARLCVIFNTPCPDTICVTVTGQGVRGSLSLSKTQMIFGKRAQCESKLDTIVCTNTGSAPVTITGSTLSGIGAAAFAILNPTTAAEVLDAGKTREYYVRFQPAAPPNGLLDATLTITTNDAQRPTIDVPLQGERAGVVVPALSLVDFGTVPSGESRASQIIVRNTGLARYCVTRLSLPAGVTSSTTLPVCLNPGEQRTIQLLFTASDTGAWTRVARVYIDLPCSDSADVTLTASVIAGGVMQATRVQFTPIASCLADRDTIVVQNKYAVGVQIDSVTLGGADANRFAIVAPTAMPQMIPAGGRALIVVEYRPRAGDTGLKSATLTTHVWYDTTRLSLRTTLEGQSIDPVMTLAATNFAATFIGSSFTQTLTITNANPFPITISSATCSDPAFTVSSTTPVLAATLASGAQLRIDIRFAPTAVRTYTAQIVVTTTTPCSLSFNGTLNGIGQQQNITQVGASIANLHAKLDEVIRIPIVLDADVGAAGVNAWSGSVTFNRTMLHPRGYVKDRTLSQNMNVVMNYDQASGTLTLTASGAPLLAGSSPLVYVEALVLLGNDVQTLITIAPTFDFTSGTARIARRSNGLFQLEGYCRAGDRLLRVPGNFILGQNHPNPFNPTTRIEYEIAFDDHVLLKVYDAMGREVANLVNGYKAAGRYDVEFKADGLPSGVYHYVLHSGRFVDIKQMVIGK